MDEGEIRALLEHVKNTRGTREEHGTHLQQFIRRRPLLRVFNQRHFHKVMKVIRPERRRREDL